MTSYILKKLFSSILILLIVSFVAFWIISVLPGDAALLALGFDATEESLAQLRAEWHLDEPLLQRYGRWLLDILQGNMGYSTHYKAECSDVIRQRLPITALLGAMSLLLGVFLGILFGILAAVNRGRAVDTIVTFFANLGVSLPTFWLGILLIYLFAVWMKLLPVSGYSNLSDGIGSFLSHSVLPVLTMSWGSMATVCRQTRSAILETLHQNHVRTARAKGLKELQIMLKHILKNSLIPVITLLGFQVRNLVGGSVVVEQIFNIPGMGRTLIQAVNSRDTSMVLSCLLIIAVITIVSTLLVDVCYGLVDPRIRKGGKT